VFARLIAKERLTLAYAVGAVGFAALGREDVAVLKLGYDPFAVEQGIGGLVDRCDPSLVSGGFRLRGLDYFLELGFVKFHMSTLCLPTDERSIALATYRVNTNI
jgi:hypothetical protein